MNNGHDKNSKDNDKQKVYGAARTIHYSLFTIH